VVPGMPTFWGCRFFSENLNVCVFDIFIEKGKKASKLK